MHSPSTDQPDGFPSAAQPPAPTPPTTPTVPAPSPRTAPTPHTESMPAQPPAPSPRSPHAAQPAHRAQRPAIARTALVGRPALIIALAGLIPWIFYRFSIYQGDHALKWRVPLDLQIYVLAGQNLSAGGNLYGQAYIGTLPFTYPPFAGVVFRWLARLSHDWLIIFWQGGTILAMFIVIVLVLRERRIALGPISVLIAAALTVASIATEPVHGTFFYGQINVFLMLLVALDVLPRRLRLPGIGIGLAAGMKLTPAYLGLVLLAQRRWFAAISSILTFAATVAVGWWLIPDAKYFWTEGVFDSSRVGVHENPGAQSLRSIFERVFDIPGGTPWLLSVAGVFILTVVAVVCAVRRSNLSLAMSLVGISACLVSPFSWYHHWVWIIPLAVTAFADTNRALSRLLVRLSPVPRVLLAQLAGLVSLVVAAALVVPFISVVVWESAAYRTLDDLPAQYQPWGQLTFTGAGVIYIAACALYGVAREVRSHRPASPARP